MKIALVARGCRPGAGIERYTFELANRLAARHQVDVLTNSREYDTCHARLIPIDVQEKPIWYSVLRFSQLAGDKAKVGQYDIVHTQGSDAYWGDVVTAHSCHSAGMRASLKIKPGPENQMRKILSPAHRNVLTMERKAVMSTRHIVAVSRLVARQIRAAYSSLRRTPIQVLYPGVDAGQYDNSTMFNIRKKFRVDLGITKNQIVLALVANDPKLKGAVRLMDAISQLKNKSIILLIASGKGEHSDLKKKANAMEIGEQVKFIAVSKDGRAIFAACDVYAGMPEYESFGLTYLEAMASGRPVLVTRNAGVAELITHEQEGLLLPALASTELLSKAIKKIVDDETLRNRFAEAARQTAEKYSWNSMVGKLEALYEQVLKEKRDRTGD